MIPDAPTRLPSDSTARRIWQRIYRLYGVRDNVTLGSGVHLGLGTVLWAPRAMRIDDDVYIGKNVTIEVDGQIGKGTLIANQVGILGRRDHDVHHIGRFIRQAAWVGDDPERLSTPVRIGSDVWIGYGAIVLGGIAVGRGAVVGAGSVVVRDVAPYAIVVGNPARVVGSRFDSVSRDLHDKLLYGQPDSLTGVPEGEWA